MEKKLTLFEFRSLFLQFYKQDKQIFKDLITNVPKLSSFPIYDNSIELSNLIEDIFDYSIDILTADQSEESCEDYMSSILIKIQTYSCNSDFPESINLIEFLLNDHEVLQSVMVFFTITTSLAYLLLKPELFHFLANNFL